MSVLREYLGLSRPAMWVGLGLFHTVLGTRMLLSDGGTPSMITAGVLFVVAGGMLGWGLYRYR